MDRHRGCVWLPPLRVLSCALKFPSCVGCVCLAGGKCVIINTKNRVCVSEGTGVSARSWRAVLLAQARARGRTCRENQTRGFFSGACMRTESSPGPCNYTQAEPGLKNSRMKRLLITAASHRKNPPPRKRALCAPRALGPRCHSDSVRGLFRKAAEIIIRSFLTRYSSGESTP